MSDQKFTRAKPPKDTKAEIGENQQILGLNKCPTKKLIEGSEQSSMNKLVFDQRKHKKCFFSFQLMSSKSASN